MITISQLEMLKRRVAFLEDTLLSLVGICEEHGIVCCFTWNELYDKFSKDEKIYHKQVHNEDFTGKTRNAFGVVNEEVVD